MIDERAVMLLRHERHRRAGMTFAIVESSSGAASAAAMKPATVSGVAGQQEHAAGDGADRSWSR